MKDIERSDLISTRYLSEIDEALVSTLNSCPQSAICAFMALHFSGAFTYRSNFVKWTADEPAGTLAVYGLIFCFICDDIQQLALQSFMLSLDFHPAPLFDFFSNSQRSQHHAVDDKMHNSITERCFSYILNRRLAHFPGTHHRASKYKRRPWLWRCRKPKGVITNSQRSRWRQKEQIGCNKKHRPFWALVRAIKYLPYLLDIATRSEELIALAKMWPYRHPLLVSPFPRDTKKAGKAVELYLARFDGKEQCESEVAVGLPVLSNV